MSGRLSGKPLQCGRGCPHGWTINMATMFCYQNFNTPKNYTAAATGCEARGGTLATASDVDGQEFVLALKGKADIIWLGLSDTLLEGTFRWEDGTRVNYTDWNARKPDHVNGEDCVRMYQNGQWGDVSCNTAILKNVRKSTSRNLKSRAGFGQV